MKNRYKLPKHIQLQYFRNIESVSGLNNEQLATLFGVVGRSYRDWRRGKFAITNKVIRIAETQFRVPFPLSKQRALFAWKRSKFAASRKGGIARLKLYGDIGTPEGRSKGGRHALQVLRARGIIPLEKPFYPPIGYSEHLAELVGILLGDGHVGASQWTITLNAQKDAIYTAYVIELVKKLFSFTPGLFHKKKDNINTIYGGGKRNIAYLQKIGLHIGNKVKQQVGIPRWIAHNPAYSRACLRGLVDTDGGIFKHTYRVNGKEYTYTRLCFSNRSIPLLRFVSDTLKTIGLTPKIIDQVENKKVWLYNQTEVKQYIERIGTSNPRLLVNLGG